MPKIRRSTPPPYGRGRRMGRQRGRRARRQPATVTQPRLARAFVALAVAHLAYSTGIGVVVHAPRHVTGPPRAGQRLGHGVLRFGPSWWAHGTADPRRTVRRITPRSGRAPSARRRRTPRRAG